MQTTTATLWEEIVSDPRFENLPYKIETTEHGQIIMSPHKLWHSYAQSEITYRLRVSKCPRPAAMPSNTPSRHRRE